MRKHEAIGTCLIAALTACSHDLDLPLDPGPLPPGGAITGRMLTQDPLSGERSPTPTAHVEVLRTTIRADATREGAFAFQPPTDHSWQALFRDGCNEDGICSLQKLMNSADLPLLPQVDFSVGDVLISANGQAQGRVQLADHSDPDHAQGNVTIYVSGAPFRTETGDNGVFVLPNLPEGTMTIGIFATGYQPQALPDVHVSPSTTVQLSPVVLQPISGQAQKGTIDGTPVRDDVQPGTAHVIALRNSIQVAEQDTSLGSPFVLADLDYGLYTLTMEVEGYGRSVVQNVLVGDPPLGAVNVHLDQVTIRNVTENPTTEPVPTCSLPASQRGPCVVGVTPTEASLLPALGLVQLQLDKPIVPQSAGIVFTSGLQTMTAELVSATPNDSGMLLVARPTRPLSPGIWTASPSTEVRDTDATPHGVAGPMPSWLVTGLAAGPAYAGAPIATGDGGGVSLRPGLTAVGETAYLTYRDTTDVAAPNQNVMRVAFTPGGTLSPFSLLSQAGTATFPSPSALATSEGPLAIRYKSCAVAGDNGTFSAAAGSIDTDVFNQVPGLESAPCADDGVLAPDAPLLLAMPRSDGQLVVYADDGAGNYGARAFPFIVSKKIAVADGHLFAIDGQDQGHLYTVTPTTLSETPDAPWAPATLKSVAACDAAGKLVLTWLSQAGDLGAAIQVDDPSCKTSPCAKVFVALPSPLRRGLPDGITCRGVGSTAFVVTSELQIRPALYAAYLSVNDAAPAQSTWVPVLDPGQADGGLNPYRDDCQSQEGIDNPLEDPTIGPGPDPDGGALVAWSQVCGFDGIHREVEVRRIR